jgi:hypothetical protein
MTEANKPHFPTSGRKAAAITFIIIFLASIVALVVAMTKDADYIVGLQSSTVTVIPSLANWAP